MLSRALTYSLAALIGVIGGGVSALYLAGLWPGMKPLDFGDVKIDGWVSDFAIGSDEANPYTRARIARHGLLALTKSEAVYFTRNTDDQGRALTEDCRYRITVRPVPAEWWSVTLYDANSMLPVNTDNALSINANQDVVASIGDQVVGRGVSAIISASRPESRGLWISSRNAGNFDLTLRLYVPDAALLEAPVKTLTPPSVTRIGCVAKVGQ